MNAAAGSTLVLDASHSSDPQQKNLTYSWALKTKPANSQANLSSTTAVKPKLTTDVPGTYQCQLVVSNGTASSDPVSITIVVVAAYQAPVASVNVAQNTKVGQTVLLDSSNSSAPSGSPVTYS